MELKQYFAQSSVGDIIAGASVFIYKYGTTEQIPALYDASGSLTEQPITSDEDGSFTFRAPDGTYSMRVVSGLRDYTVTIQCFDATSTIQRLSNTPLTFASYDDAQAYDYSEVAGGTAVLITDEWRGGLFTYTDQNITSVISNDPGYGVSIPTGFSSIGTSGGLLRTSNMFEQANACWWGFKTGTTEDMRVPLQRAINYIEAIDIRRTMVTPKGTAYLQTVSAATPTNGDNDAVGILIRKPSRLKWIADNTRIDLDTGAEDVRGITAVLAIAPDVSSDQAYLHMEGMTLSGGNWASKDDRPEYVIKANYMVMSYSVLRDINLYYASVDNIRYCGFVCEFTNVRARFAGVQGANFKFVVEALNGDAAARTAYYLEKCVADYAGLFGYRFIGGNGHTYCHLDTCAADHIGRDENNATIADNVATAAAYGIDNVRSFVMTACGAEWCNRAINGSNTRNMTINSLYGVNCGTTDGTAIDSFINLTGFFEFVTMDNIENRSGKNFEYWLNMTNSDDFNYNSVTIDRSIPRNRINMTGQETAVFTQVYSLNDWYKEGMRCPGGDAMLMGDRLNTNGIFNWFDQNKYGVSKTFHIRSDAEAATFELIELTNPNVEGYLSFILEMRIGRTTGSDPAVPSKYIVSTSAALNGVAIPVVEKVGTAAPDVTVTAEWTEENKLAVTLGNAYSVALVTAYVVGRPSTSTQTFEWIEQDNE